MLLIPYCIFTCFRIILIHQISSTYSAIDFWLSLLLFSSYALCLSPKTCLQYTVKWCTVNFNLTNKIGINRRITLVLYYVYSLTIYRILCYQVLCNMNNNNWNFSNGFLKDNCFGSENEQLYSLRMVLSSKFIDLALHSRSNILTSSRAIGT